MPELWQAVPRAFNALRRNMNDDFASQLFYLTVLEGLADNVAYFGYPLLIEWPDGTRQLVIKDAVKLIVGKETR